MSVTRGSQHATDPYHVSLHAAYQVRCRAATPLREVPSRESSCVRTRSAVSLAKEGTCPSLPPGVFSFAFVRPAMPPAIDVQMPTTPLSADSPVLMPAGCKVVRATAAFATWTAVAADGSYGARVALPTGRMIAIFLPRCSIGPLLADVAASRKAHILNLRFYGSAWAASSPSSRQAVRSRFLSIRYLNFTRISSLSLLQSRPTCILLLQTTISRKRGHWERRPILPLVGPSAFYHSLRWTRSRPNSVPTLCGGHSQSSANLLAL